MKKTINNIKYLWLLSFLFIFVACNEIEDVIEEYEGTPEEVVIPDLTAGTANFSNFVALGASFTAGFTDNALFIASQENSFPNMLAMEFAKVGGGNFSQPMTSDNLGGLAAGGTRIANPRLVFDPVNSAPTGLEALVGPVTVTTDIVLNNPSGPFNNMGVPGAKSFHLLSNTYGDLAGVGIYSNPYFVRMASGAGATMLGDAAAQNPTFFTISEIGGNDVLGYATSGGSGVDQTGNFDPSTYGGSDITDPNVFAQALNVIVTTMTANGSKGVIANVPYITSLPHFTTVPYNPITPDALGDQVTLLNQVYGAVNQIYAGAGEPERAITFSSTGASPVVVIDEDVTDLTVAIATTLGASPTFVPFVQSLGLPAAAAPLVAQLLGQQYGKARSATDNDLFVLPSSSVIGTVNTGHVANLITASGGLLPQTLAGTFAVEGVTLPLEDKWVLTPQEQNAIKTATDAYNSTIASMASANANLGLVDLNSILTEVATTGITIGDFTLTADLVLGGAVSLDGIHLTARGYSLMAYKFLEAIDAEFGSNFIASGNYPDPGSYPTNYSPLLQ